MENFKQQELNTATLKPAHWFSHINDTCMVWPCGRDELEKVLGTPDHHPPKLRFMLEMEEYN
jgi:hypothetical protein